MANQAKKHIHSPKQRTQSKLADFTLGYELLERKKNVHRPSKHY